MSLTKPLLSLIQPRAIAYASYVKGGSVVADPSTTGADTWPAPPASAPGDFSTGNAIEVATTNQWGAWTPFCTVGATGTNFDSVSGQGSGTTVSTGWGATAAGNMRVIWVCRGVSDGTTPSGWTRILHDNWNGANHMSVYWRLCNNTSTDGFSSTSTSSSYAYKGITIPAVLASGEAPTVSTGAAFAATATFDPDTVTRIGKFISFFMAATNVNVAGGGNPSDYNIESVGVQQTAAFSCRFGMKNNSPIDTIVFAQGSDNPGTGTFGGVGTGEAWTVAIPASNKVAAETLAVGAWCIDTSNTLWQIGAGEPGAQVVRGTYVMRGAAGNSQANMEIAAKFAAGEKVWVRQSSTSARTMAIQVMPTANIG